VLQRIACLAVAAPRRVILAASLIMVGAALFGVPVFGSLPSGGFQDPASESSRAAKRLLDTFGQADMQLVFVVTAPDGADGAAARDTGLDIIGSLKNSPDVIQVASPWTSPPQASSRLLSTDGRSALIAAGMTGGADDAPKHAQRLAGQIDRSVLPRHGGVSVLSGGSAMVYTQVNGQTQRDVLLMESIAVPLSLLVLVWVFGGIVAAVLPVTVAGLAIFGSMSALRLLAFYTDVSVFALNLATALSLALAIDYTLLIVSRYRDELAAGADRDLALLRTMVTAGRTVLFSATTVALSMAAMALFPMYFLRSFAYAGIATVTLCAMAAVIVTPAAISVLGPRLDALDVRSSLRRLLRRPEPRPKPAERLFWYRSTKFVLRHAVIVGVAGVTLLIMLGMPFLGSRWGFPDDRVLPTSASAHQVGDRLRSGFADNSETAVTVVVPDVAGVLPAELDRYASDLSRVTDVSSVSAPGGTFVGGRKVGPPAAVTGLKDGSAFLTVDTSAPLFSSSSANQVDRLHKVAGPGGRAVEMTGTSQVNRDSVVAIASRLPVVMCVIATITFALLFLLTGSLLLPLKALVLNTLSLSATFGALVWIFQDGHLGAFGTTPTGTLVANIPVLLFCIAFGLSMDYEVFLLARIREFWLASGRTGADVDESVALGLARTGRVVTAAALIMAISFGGLVAAQVSFMRMFGLGLALAVLVDATLVRMILLPVFMHLLGRWNWWAPARLARLHDRIAIRDVGDRVFAGNVR
jgi:putative drug exporter of the RND superfamily